MSQYQENILIALKGMLDEMLIEQSGTYNIATRKIDSLQLHKIIELIEFLKKEDGI